jgi:hypothetical protein
MQLELPTPEASVHSLDITCQHGLPASAAEDAADLYADVAFRHAGWIADRVRTARAIDEVFPASPRLERFRYCGSNAWVISNDSDPSQVAVVADHCHDRFCRPCARWRGSVIAGNINAHLADRPYRFLTLTIKTDGLTLPQAVDKLYTSFARLRRTRIWQQRVTGGCAVCEIKPRASGTGWHPHLHCILEGRYLPQPVIRKHWERITTDSYIVDIRPGRDSAAAAHYVSKYITKPFGSAVIRNHDRLCEAIEALHNRRVIHTFGSWRGLKLCHFEPSGTWSRVCTLAELRSKARRGDPDAQELLTHLTGECVAAQIPNPRPQPEPPERRLWQ